MYIGQSKCCFSAARAEMTFWPKKSKQISFDSGDLMYNTNCLGCPKIFKSKTFSAMQPVCKEAKVHFELIFFELIGFP
jgi:hypothetical protein